MFPVLMAYDFNTSIPESVAHYIKLRSHNDLVSYMFKHDGVILIGYWTLFIVYDILHT
jgi:hypothetical protein